MAESYLTDVSFNSSNMSESESAKPFKRYTSETVLHVGRRESEYSVSDMHWSPSGRYLVYICNEREGASSVQVAALRPPPQLHEASAAAPDRSASIAAATASAFGPETAENRRLEVVQRFEADLMSAQAMAHADPKYRVHWTCASVGESVLESASPKERVALLLVILATCCDNRGYSKLLLLRWLEPRSKTTACGSSATGSCGSTEAIGERFMCDISKHVLDAVVQSGSVAFGNFGDCWLAPDASRGLVKLGSHSMVIVGLLKGEAALAVRQTTLEGTSTAEFSKDARLLVLTGFTKKHNLTLSGQQSPLDRTIWPAFVQQKQSEPSTKSKCCFCFKNSRVQSSLSVARVASISSSSDSEVEIPRHEYLRFNRGLYAIDIHHQRVRHLDFRFCTDICIVDQEFPDQTVKYTVIVLSKTDMIDVPKIQIFGVTPTEHMLVFEVAFESGFPLDSFPGHLRPSHIILHRDANHLSLYVFATQIATPDTIRKYYSRGNRGEEDSTAVRYVIINLLTRTSSEPYVLQVGHDADTVLLHPSLPLLASFPLSLVPLASETPLASSPPATPAAAASAVTSLSEQPSSPLLEPIREMRDDSVATAALPRSSLSTSATPLASSPPATPAAAASAVTSSSEQPSSPLLEPIRELREDSFATAASLLSADYTSAFEDYDELEFIDAEEMPGFSDTTPKSCEQISTVDDEAEHQL